MSTAIPAVLRENETAPLSLEEFLKMGGEHYHDFHELHNGEIVLVPPLTAEHLLMQARILELLRSALSSNYVVQSELYLTLASESRRTDIGVVQRRRLEEQKHKVFFGAPDIAVEILSPSNTVLDLDHLRHVCLQHGTRQFWLVNMDQKTITVYKPDFLVTVHHSGNPDIPLDLEGEATVSTNAIFEQSETK